MELEKTFNWIDTGPYKEHSASMFACCYTHKDGRKMKNILMFWTGDDFDELKKKAEDSMSARAVVGGAWELQGTVGEIKDQCEKDMHEIMFSPF